MRANSRRWARTGGGAASTPIVDAASLLVRALFRFPSPAKLPATQADKDPNNALDPNNSEVQLIETVIKGIAHPIYLSPLNSEITFWELFFPGVNNLFYNMKTLCIKDKSQA